MPPPSGQIHRARTHKVTRNPGSLAADALKAKLLAHAKASSLSGTGVHLVLRRVLKDERFVESKEGYTFKRDAHAAASA